MELPHLNQGQLHYLSDALARVVVSRLGPFFATRPKVVEELATGQITEKVACVIYENLHDLAAINPPDK